jgi:hypothetical protein
VKTNTETKMLIAVIIMVVAIVAMAIIAAWQMDTMRYEVPDQPVLNYTHTSGLFGSAIIPLVYNESCHHYTVQIKTTQSGDSVHAVAHWEWLHITSNRFGSSSEWIISQNTDGRMGTSNDNSEIISEFSMPPGVAYNGMRGAFTPDTVRNPYITITSDTIYSHISVVINTTCEVNG